MIIPAVAVVFTLIGVLDFLGVWAAIEAGIGSLLSALAIEPTRGAQLMWRQPHLAVAQLPALTGIDPAVGGRLVLANSGFPFGGAGSSPATWAESTGLPERTAYRRRGAGVWHPADHSGGSRLLAPPFILR